MRTAIAILSLAALSCVPDHGDAICRLGASECGGRCVVTALDPGNCGACGVACAAGEVCREGACGPLCGDGLAACGGACVALAADPAHCGACDNACAASQVCSAGACSDACIGGSEPCGGGCVDTDSSAAHCGGCDAPCAPADACVGGSCLPACGDGMLCGDACVDTTTASAHCGACDAACLGGRACVDSGCRPYCGADPCASCAPWWSLSAGSMNTAGNQRAEALVATAAGEVVVAFEYSSSLSIGAEQYPALGIDVAVAWLGPTGNVIWSKRLSGPGDDHATAVAIDAAGNVIVAGNFEGTITVDTVSLTSTGAEDGFVIALAPSSGTPLWGVRIGGGAGAIATAQALAVDANAIFVGGVHTGAASVVPAGGGAPQALPVAGEEDIFVARIDASGALGWAQGFGAPKSDFLTGVAAAGGRVFITGWFERDIDIVGDPAAILSFGPHDVSHRAREGAYVAALAPESGAPAWARGYAAHVTSDTIQAHATAIAADATGSVWLAGEFTNNVYVDDDFLPAASSWDGMLVQIDAASAAARGWAFGDAGADRPNAIAVDETGRLAIAGLFSGRMEFVYLDSDKVLETAGEDDVFLVLFDPPLSSDTPPVVRCAQAFGGEEDQRALAVGAVGGAAFIAGQYRDTLTLDASHVSTGNDDAFVAAFGM
jgi:outer membrane protein assembly factor BamB